MILIHEDVNGVTTIPKEIAAEVAEVGDAYVAAEMVILVLLAPVRTGSEEAEGRKEGKQAADAGIEGAGGAVGNPHPLGLILQFRTSSETGE